MLYVSDIRNIGKTGKDCRLDNIATVINQLKKTKMRKITFLLLAVSILLSTTFSCTPPELENDQQTTEGEPARDKEIDPDEVS